MESFDLFLTSKRNTQIPCTITLPDIKGPMDLLIMAHGFCATRNENGTFPMLAALLSKENIATIRCDFPGCNDSTENHKFNNIENNMDNLDTLMEYMKESYDIHNIGVLGYSMGGKVALHYTQRHPEIHTIGLWAPAAMNGLEKTSLEPLITEQYHTLHEGEVYDYDNPFDNRIIPLGYDFFKQCYESRSNDYFSAYTHNVIMVYGSCDVTVQTELLDAVCTTANPNANFVQHVVEGADHGFGAWNNHPEQMEELVQVTADFMIENLKSL